MLSGTAANSCDFGMQQFWVWDGMVVCIMCDFLSKQKGETGYFRESSLFIIGLSLKLALLLPGNIGS